MNVGTIGEIRRYPVKSMAGESLTSVQLGPNGLPGDRAWAVRDEVRGGIRGAKKIPKLMSLSARYPSPPNDSGSSPAEITLPDGSVVETGASDINETLSRVVEREVSLWPLLPADALDHYRRGQPTHADMDSELRDIFGRTPDEPLPDLSVFPPELMVYESPPGTYFDAFPLLILSESALAKLTELAPNSRIDVRRFRPNLVVNDTDPNEEMPEMNWQGRRLRFGSAVVRMTVACPRCVMVTHGFDDLPKDPSLMRTLVREVEGNVGIYAEVEGPGLIQVGDSVELLDD